MGLEEREKESSASLRFLLTEFLSYINTTFSIILLLIQLFL